MQRAHVVLPKVESMNNAYVEVTAGGEVAFASPDSPGAGIFRVRPGACSGPSFVIVDYSVEWGEHLRCAIFSEPRAPDRHSQPDRSRRRQDTCTWSSPYQRMRSC